MDWKKKIRSFFFITVLLGTDLCMSGLAPAPTNVSHVIQVNFTGNRRMYPRMSACIVGELCSSANAMAAFYLVFVDRGLGVLPPRDGRTMIGNKTAVTHPGIARAARAYLPVLLRLRLRLRRSADALLRACFRPVRGADC